MEMPKFRAKSRFDDDYQEAESFYELFNFFYGLDDGQLDSFTLQIFIDGEWKDIEG